MNAKAPGGNLRGFFSELFGRSDSERVPIPPRIDSIAESSLPGVGVLRVTTLTTKPCRMSYCRMFSTVPLASKSMAMIFRSSTFGSLNVLSSIRSLM